MNAIDKNTNYVVTARKWRPMIFSEIVGQSHITTTLQNAIITNRLSHAYIFSGPRGVGKTTTARILAKAINCVKPNGPNPDNSCELCKEITEGRSINVFEIDGASNRGIEEIRNLREAVRYGPAKGNYKVYIIDEVHMLTKEAFNALLKTLEEPPSYVMFIFATTEIHKVPLTILSRCQRFDFRRISLDEIFSRMKFIAREEKINIDDESLQIIAKHADGSMRDAQSIFDQAVSFCGKNIKTDSLISILGIVDEEIFFKLIEIIKNKDVKSGLLMIDEIINRGYDIREFLNGLIEHFRNILVVQTTGSSNLIETSDVYRKRYENIKNIFSENDLLRFIKIASDTESSLRWTQQPRIKLEIGLMNMLKLDSSVEISEIIETIDEIKKNINLNQDSFSNRTGNATTSGTNTPIKGNVKASPPFLAPHQIVSLHEGESINNLQEDKTNLYSSPVSSENKWSKLVEEALKERIAVGMVLNQTSLVEFRDNKLCIACPDDFHLESLNLKKNRQYLQDLAERVYGAKMQLETILSSNANQKPVTNNRISGEPTLKEHPIVQKLMREFGASPIDR